MNGIKGFERFNTVHDAEDLLNDCTVIEQTDMVVASQAHILSRYVEDSNKPNMKYVYIDKLISKNAAGQAVCIQTVYNGHQLPSWVPAGLIV